MVTILVNILKIPMTIQLTIWTIQLTILTMLVTILNILVNIITIRDFFTFLVTIRI